MLVLASLRAAVGLVSSPGCRAETALLSFTLSERIFSIFVPKLNRDVPMRTVMTLSRTRKNAGTSLLPGCNFRLSEASSSSAAKTSIPRMSFDNKVLPILPIRSLMTERRDIPAFTNSLHLTVLRLLDTLFKLEVELLMRCGMMPRSEQRSLVGREVLDSSSSSVTAPALEGWITAFSHRVSQTLGALPLVLRGGKPSSIGAPFWWDPASKRKTWLPRSVFQWAR